MNELVSIITPCYNSSLFITTTITSVIDQTYQNWELLMIDDCSTDDTAHIINDFCRQDARIKYLKTNKASGSPALPRNIGLQESKGRYIAFLDSDDVWFPCKLEEQLNFIIDNNYSFVYSNYEKMSFEGLRNKRIVKAKEISNYGDLLKSCEIPCLTVILKKKIINKKRFKHLGKEDYVFWLEILKTGVIAYNTNKIHALYREAKKSRSSNKIKMILQQWDILRSIENLSFCFSVYYLFTYALKGFVKYLK